MKVLVIGGGGREHALAWKLAHSPKAHKIYVAPGNAGTALHPYLDNLPFNGVDDIAALCAWARQERIDLTVVGPEAPLAAGVVDAFRAQGLRIFGPTQAAARLESSKAFSKDFMQRHGIPTAAYASFTDAASACHYIDAQGAPIVVKADGLAAGKGVVVAMTVAEAHAAVQAMLPADAAPGSRVVIEAYLEGEEASFMVLAHGKHALALATSQDHKRLQDGDLGPNTGGMGAYSPAPVVTPAVHAKAMREVILPTLRGMAAEGHPYTGFLYAGLMVAPDGKIQTLEFNCRMGDPETQPILMRLRSDLLDALLQACDDKLETLELEWDRQAALGVVMAAPGYPGVSPKGEPIGQLPADQADLMVFHAGSALDAEKQVRTNGGRVLCVTALGETLAKAQEKAYTAVQKIHFPGAQYRHDIGYRALKKN